MTLRDFVLTGLPPTSLIGPGCGTGCDVAMSNGFASWTAPFLNGIANFYSSSKVHLVAPVEGLLFSNSRLLACSSGWGESGVHIGRNLLHQTPGGVAINNVGLCPLAATQRLVDTTGLAATLPFRADLAGERFGPQGRVGLSETQTVTSDADLDSLFAIPAAPCANAVDDDWDGLGDLADPGCSDGVDASEHTSTWACDDGVDNDGDGRVDAGFDPGCPMAIVAARESAVRRRDRQRRRRLHRLRRPALHGRASLVGTPEQLRHRLRARRPRPRLPALRARGDRSTRSLIEPGTGLA